MNNNEEVIYKHVDYFGDINVLSKSIELAIREGATNYIININRQPSHINFRDITFFKKLSKKEVLLNELKEAQDKIRNINAYLANCTEE